MILKSEIDDFPRATEASNIISNKFKRNGKGKKMDHLVSRKKRKLMEKNNDLHVEGVHQITSMDEVCPEGTKKKQPSKADRKNKKEKLARRKLRKKEKGSVAVVDKVKQLGDKGDDCSNEPKSGVGTHAKKSTESETQSENDDLSRPKEASDIISKKLKKNGKGIKEDHLVSKKEGKFVKGKNDVEVEKVYHITSVDEDCSKGMKKWLIEYHQSRPGLKVLQQRIDEFMVAHDAQEEQAQKERESRAAEGGWTVVVHHKGRKKTTDSESGITVGSVAQAALVDKMAKKKSKEVPLNFYSFQRREAQRNEVMMLQSKFEQDKKRIQQLRAARKFRPY